MSRTVSPQRMRVGQLSTPIAIERKTASQDDWGQPLPDAWVPVATVWANVRHLSGSEAIKADAVTSTVRASIRIRWRTGLDASMRVVHGATVYAIKAVMPDLVRREYVDLVCEVTNA